MYDEFGSLVHTAATNRYFVYVWDRGANCSLTCSYLVFALVICSFRGVLTFDRSF